MLRQERGLDKRGGIPALCRNEEVAEVAKTFGDSGSAETLGEFRYPKTRLRQNTSLPVNPSCIILYLQGAVSLTARPPVLRPRP